MSVLLQRHNARNTMAAPKSIHPFNHSTWISKLKPNKLWTVHFLKESGEKKNKPELSCSSNTSDSPATANRADRIPINSAEDDARMVLNLVNHTTQHNTTYTDTHFHHTLWTWLFEAFPNDPGLTEENSDSAARFTGRAAIGGRFLRMLISRLSLLPVGWMLGLIALWFGWKKMQFCKPKNRHSLNIFQLSQYGI